MENEEIEEITAPRVSDEAKAFTGFALLIYFVAPFVIVSWLAWWVFLWRLLT